MNNGDIVGQLGKVHLDFHADLCNVDDPAGSVATESNIIGVAGLDLILDIRLRNECNGWSGFATARGTAETNDIVVFP